MEPLSNPVAIFGDVHGNATGLRTLIDRVRTQSGPGTDLYSVGDLVDRGPDVRGVLDICVKEKIKGVTGNHEIWLREVLSGKAMTDFPYQRIMGGLATLSSYGLYRGDPDHVGPAIRRAVPKEHREWLLALPPYQFIEVGGLRYCLLHAGISVALQDALLSKVPDVPEDGVINILSEHAVDAFFWSGPKPTAPKTVVHFKSFVQVFGHTPTAEVVIAPGHYIALDTGSGTCAPFALSAVILYPDGGHEIIRVDEKPKGSDFGDGFIDLSFGKGLTK